MPSLGWCRLGCDLSDLSYRYGGKMSKFISKQSVAIWYALSALLATFIVGQVILCFFPDGKSTGDSLLFILMKLIPLIMAAIFSLVLSEIKSLGEFFKKVFLQKESHLSWILAFFIPVIYYGISISLYWELPLSLRPISALDLFIWRPGRSRLALVFTRSSLL